MSTILKRAKAQPSTNTEKFARYNLKVNPFPSNAFINKDIPDKRYNGKIYEDKIRENEMKKAIDNFIQVPQSNPNHLRLGYIKDTSYIGRGNGKSSFSVNLLRNINNNFCLDLSNDVNKCFGLYISPEPSGRTKNFYQLIDLFFQSIIDLNIINYCLGLLRLEELINLYDFDYENKFDNEKELIQKLNDFNFFKENEFEINKITINIYKKYNHLQNISKSFPLYADRNNFYSTTITTQDNIIKYYTKLKKGKEKIDFIFNDLVHFFLASGFNGAYIIIDDFERIPDWQSARQKREFALELRTNFFDGVSQNAKIGFYNLMLVLHAGVDRLVGDAWGNAGIEQRSPIISTNDNSKHVIFFEQLEHKHAVMLIRKYLEEYRISDQEENKLHPFKEDAVHKIAELAELNASEILQKANQLLEKAADDGIDIIDIDFVIETFGKSKNIKENTPKSIVDEPTEDLLSE